MFSTLKIVFRIWLSRD